MEDELLLGEKSNSQFVNIIMNITEELFNKKSDHLFSQGSFSGSFVFARI